MTTKSKGGQPATGNVKWLFDQKAKVWCWHGRFTVNGKRRPYRPLDPNITRDEIERAHACAAETSAFLRGQPTTEWRPAVAIALYTYARDGELRALRWDEGDVDLDPGVLSITRAYSQAHKRVSQTKTGHTRRFSLEPNVLPLLQAMRKEASGKGPVLSLTISRRDGTRPAPDAQEGRREPPRAARGITHSQVDDVSRPTSDGRDVDGGPGR